LSRAERGLRALHPSPGARRWALQVVEFVAVQVTVLDPPGRMWVGWGAESDARWGRRRGARHAQDPAVGARCPPGPEQVIEYAYSPANGDCAGAEPTRFDRMAPLNHPNPFRPWPHRRLRSSRTRSGSRSLRAESRPAPNALTPSGPRPHDKHLLCPACGAAGSDTCQSECVGPDR